MEMFIVLIFSVVAIPLVVGYLYGLRDIDPNSTEGKSYYESGE